MFFSEYRPASSAKFAASIAWFTTSARNLLQLSNGNKPVRLRFRIASQSEQSMAGLGKLIGQVLDGKYQLDRLLGQGGMGAVFLATHLGTKRPVALKVIAPQFMANEEVSERFRREAEAAG